jgi:serine/threonine protein kinase
MRLWQSICFRTDDEIKKNVASDDDISLKFDNEVNIQKEVATHGLAPEIYDSWKCSHGGVIIMGSMRMTVDSLFEEIIKYQDDAYHSEHLPIIPQIDIYKFVVIITKKLLYQHNKLMSINVCHQDLHLNNVMITFDKKEDIYEGKFDLKFIDFGQSRKTTKEKCFDMMVVYRAYEYYLHLIKISELKFFFNYSLLLLFNNNTFLQTIVNKPYVDKSYLEKYNLSRMKRLIPLMILIDKWITNNYFKK